MKIAVVLGTRPEIIKLSPVIRELERTETDFFILHTGQHYSRQLDAVFFNQLELPWPRYNIGVGSGSHAQMISRILERVEGILFEEHPDIVLVLGDTNSTLAGALAASKLGIKIGHVEAGLRSCDRTMPEEINRILVDHCSDYLFAPTVGAKDILLGEGIPESRIFVTGNTVVDAVYQNRELADKVILATLGIYPKEYMLATIHRQENVDNKARFISIMVGLDQVAADVGLPVIYPIHPRAKKMLAEVEITTWLTRMIEPVDYLSFLSLERYAKLILTDSGGVQEEACILGVPCVTLRDNTERPETLEVGANMLAGANAREILGCAKFMADRSNSWDNPFGDGHAGERIVEILHQVGGE